MTSNTNRMYVNHDSAGLRSYADIADFARCDIAEVKEAVKLADWAYRKQGMAAARKYWTVTDGKITAGDYSKYVAVANFIVKRRLARSHE